MNEVRIIIDGIEHTVPKEMFADMMYACSVQADVWYYNNNLQNNEDLAYKWEAAGSRAIELKTFASDSEE